MGLCIDTNVFEGMVFSLVIHPVELNSEYASIHIDTDIGFNFEISYFVGILSPLVTLSFDALGTKEIGKIPDFSLTIQIIHNFMFFVS